MPVWSTPFLYHWYDGVPPFTGSAVKVTDVPAHDTVSEAVTDTDGTTVVVSVMMT